MEPIQLPMLAAGAGHAVAFYATAAVAVAAAIMMLTQKNPVASVMWLVLSFVGFAGLFLTLQAYFLAVIQVLVYAGAIMVLFLFVIMLLNLRAEDLKSMRLPSVPLVGIVAAVLFLAAIVSIVSASKPFFDTNLAEVLGQTAPTLETGSVKQIGLPLFREWLLPFEAVSILLLAAIVGAVALTKKKL